MVDRVLDNPALAGLNEVQANLGRTSELAAVYDPQVSPLAGLNELSIEALAELELTGGEIRNVLILAIARAAVEGSALTTEALLEAGREEADQRLADPFDEERKRIGREGRIGFGIA
jgi:hypothetical protein